MTREEIIAMFADPKDRLSFYRKALKFYTKEHKYFLECGFSCSAYFCFRLYELDHPLMNKIRNNHEENGGSGLIFFGESDDDLFEISDLFPEIKKPKITLTPSEWFGYMDYESRIKILEAAINEVKKKMQ